MTSTVQDGVVAALEERVEELTREILDKDELIVHLQAEKRELRRWAEQLHHQLSANQPTAPIVVAHDAKTSDLERQVTEATERIKSLVTQCTANKDEIASLYRKVYEKEQECQELVVQLQSVRNQLADLQCQVPVAAHSPEGSPRKANEWTEETTRYPTPHFAMDSNEVHYLVSQWTQNPTKIKSLMLWLVAMSEDADEPVSIASKLPVAIELPRLSNEVRDGFLTLVVPLLRKQMTHQVFVHTRPYDQRHTDLRIRVAPK
ncbi:hypothetical protein LEN26_007835 [Aphanomyces euteiches]|nr:hypothetical protein AeMF1_008847 [Aphanomyces euteiches]KAH9131191.1 hypothetical protein LEN26_007835 [Aphanomyces euteiches]KAH9196237.1 hypothetical protein AeNC1_001801 [Aphanomyces euteiches]